MNTAHQPAERIDITPAEILRCAAKYLQRHGWTQRDYYRPAVAHPYPAACALGAIGMAAHGRPLVDPVNNDLPTSRDFDAAYTALCDFIIRTDDAYDDEDIIGAWNDYQTRTAEQVIAALNAAADEWDRTHGGAA